MVSVFKIEVQHCSMAWNLEPRTFLLACQWPKYTGLSFDNLELQIIYLHPFTPGKPNKLAW